MRHGRALWAIASLAALSSAAADPQPVRVEARSSDLLAVGTVHGSRMTIHLSRLADNAPVRDASVSVTLRGASHAAVAETDGSYTVETPDLGLPGAAAVGFDVTQGSLHEDLNGKLDGAGPEKTDGNRGNTRQIGWWVLNFAVCIGFLMLWQRRKSRVMPED